VFLYLTPFCLQDSFRILGIFSWEVLFVFKVMCTDLINGLWFGFPCCKDILHFILSKIGGVRPWFSSESWLVPETYIFQEIHILRATLMSSRSYKLRCDWPMFMIRFCTKIPLLGAQIGEKNSSGFVLSALIYSLRDGKLTCVQGQRVAYHMCMSTRSPPLVAVRWA
jgi:hypothetical protein